MLASILTKACLPRSASLFLLPPLTRSRSFLGMWTSSPQNQASNPCLWLPKTNRTVLLSDSCSGAYIHCFRADLPSSFWLQRSCVGPGPRAQGVDSVVRHPTFIFQCHLPFFAVFDSPEAYPWGLAQKMAQSVKSLPGKYEEPSLSLRIRVKCLAWWDILIILTLGSRDT